MIYHNKLADKLPILFMLMGLPASGKSAVAEKLCVGSNDKIQFPAPLATCPIPAIKVTHPVIHSSDGLRKELYGDESNQEHNGELFNELHRRIKEDLRNGNDVIYDATNISKKRRKAFIQELKNIPCYKVCVAVMTPYELCLKQNSSRERKVPDHVICRMYLNWNPPSYDEGFEDILIDYHYESDENIDKYTLENFFTGEIGADFINQENSHHTYTIGNHCRAAGEYLKEHYPDDSILHTAGLMHDIGKVFTKSPINSKGEIDGDHHYYQHHCVGAYDSFFYTDAMELLNFDKLRIANLIYYHMMPFTAWKQSPKVEQKHRTQIGEQMYNDIIKLHEADLATH